jgi:excinuclease UvrABC nuclease subunit
MREQTVELNPEESWKVPIFPGVYLIHYEKETLYIGKATDLRTRFLGHLRGSHNPQLKRAITEKPLLFSFWLFFTERELSQAERQLIQRMNPKFNKIRYLQEY